MIIRIVQMTFHEENVDEFLTLFNERKQLIRHFEGCNHLELWRDERNANIFFTYSKWDSIEHLSRYRYSELFKDTWAKTKALFADKPQAWSVSQQMLVE